MNKQEERLQAQLEQLETGVPLAELVTELPEEEAALLQLAATLRTMEAPVRDAGRVAAQKEAIVALTQESTETRSNSIPIWQSLRGWLQEHRPAVAAGVALAAIVLLVMFALPNQQSKRVAVAIVANNKPGHAPTAVAQPADSAAERETSAVAAAPRPSTQTAAETAYELYVPAIGVPGALNAGEVELQQLVGLIKVQAASGSWTAVSRATILRAGDRVRTGNLSTAQLLFYDGSRAIIGPDSEIRLDIVDAQRPETGFRDVILTQVYGESEHQVQFRNDAGSRYEVKTPTGSGIARGTKFRVVVNPDGRAGYTVTEGRVDVTNENQTVRVIAGQTTTFSAQTPPADPIFIVTGEGIVSEMGAIWLIAGQPFAVNEDTLVVGNPQLGDLVRVVGHLQDEGPPLADRIELLRPAPGPGFALTGLVEVIGADTWIIAGQTISVTAATDIDPGIVVGDRVRAEGQILPGGWLLAEKIRLLGLSQPSPFEFTGVVQTILSDTWTISGVDVTVDANTEIDDGIIAGDLVKAEGYILPDGTWLANEIKLVAPGDTAFSITGFVDSIDPWIVSGLSFATELWTAIDPGIEIGDLVRVNGRILADGTWVAYEIIKLDDDTLLQIVFVGIVDAIDPWVVNSLPLFTDNDTLIDPGITVGDLVRVTALIRSDNTWLATRIEKLDAIVDPGCVAITAVIIDLNGNEIIISNGQTIILGPGIAVDGELQVGSVVLIVACANPDGTIIIVSITVITGPAPPPPPPSPQPTPPPPGSGNVTICHKPGTPAEQTKTIPRSALGGHLGHGDTMGPCP